MAVVRMDNVGFVVNDMDAAVDLFLAIGQELEGRGTCEGPWMVRTIAFEGAGASSQCSGRRTATAAWS